MMDRMKDTQPEKDGIIRTRSANSVTNSVETSVIYKCIGQAIEICRSRSPAQGRS